MRTGTKYFLFSAVITQFILCFSLDAQVKIPAGNQIAVKKQVLKSVRMLPLPAGFPEIAIPAPPRKPSMYITSSDGPDLHVYFTAAHYDRKTRMLTFSFEVANWGDKPCTDTFAYNVYACISSVQKIHETDWKDRAQKLRYNPEFVAAGPPQQPVSLATGAVLSQTVTWDMNDPVIWSAEVVEVRIRKGSFTEGHTEQDLKQQDKWNYSDKVDGTYDNFAELRIRPEDFNRRYVAQAIASGNILKQDGTILTIEFALFRNVGVSSMTLTNYRFTYALYDRKIESKDLLAHPERYENFKIKQKPLYTETRTYVSDEIKAKIGTDMLDRGAIFPFIHYASKEAWDAAKTVLVKLEWWDEQKAPKYPGMSRVVYYK